MACLCGHEYEDHGMLLICLGPDCDCTVYEPDAAEAAERAHDEEPPGDWPVPRSGS